MEDQTYDNRTSGILPRSEIKTSASRGTNYWMFAAIILAIVVTICIVALINMNNDNNSLQKQVDDKIKEINQLTQKIKDMTDAASNAQLNLVKKSKELDDKVGQYNQLILNYQKVSKDLDDITSANAMLQSELNKKTTSLDKLKKASNDLVSVLHDEMKRLNDIDDLAPAHKTGFNKIMKAAYELINKIPDYVYSTDLLTKAKTAADILIKEADNIESNISNTTQADVTALTVAKNNLMNAYNTLMLFPALVNASGTDGTFIIDPNNANINAKLSSLGNYLKKYFQYKNANGAAGQKNRIPVGYLKNTILHGWSFAGDNSYYGNDTLTGWQRIDNSADDDVAMVITGIGSKTYDSKDNHVGVKFKWFDDKTDIYRIADNTHDSYVYQPFNVLRNTNQTGWDNVTDTVDLDKFTKGITFDRRSVRKRGEAPQKLTPNGEFNGDLKECKRQCETNPNCAAAVMVRGASSGGCRLVNKGAIITADEPDSKALSVYVPGDRFGDVSIMPF